MTFEAIVRAWAEPLGLALAAMLAGLIAYRISRPIVQRLTRHSRVLRAVAERMDGPLHVMLPLAALAVVLDGAPDTAAGNRGRPPLRRRAADRRVDLGGDRRGARRQPTQSRC